jgi:propanediol utilization protein
VVVTVTVEAADIRIPVAISARHVHLCQRTINVLFGCGYVLRPLKPLSQPGQFASEETVALVGPTGRIPHVRVLGPPRSEDQIEISRTDELALGLNAPLRLSGDLVLWTVNSVTYWASIRQPLPEASVWCSASPSVAEDRAG